MDLRLLKKNEAFPSSGLPIDLMVEAMGAMDQFLKSEGRPSAADAFMGTSALVLVEGGKDYTGDGVRLHLKKHLMVSLLRGHRGEVIRANDKPWQVGLTPKGEFHASASTLPDELFQSVENDPNVAPGSVQSQVFSWLENGARGASSETLCAHLSRKAGMPQCGLKLRTEHPHDPSDFRRCMKFFEAVPAVKLFFSEMKSVSPEWNALVDHWPALEALYDQEKGQESAPKLYAEMQRVLMAARVQQPQTPASQPKPTV
jgi:hypothetical protein